MSRFIGIRHRTKAFGKAKARPTEVCIIDAQTDINALKIKLGEIAKKAVKAKKEDEDESLEGEVKEDGEKFTALKMKNLESYKLQTEREELDLLLNQFPIEYRELGADEDVNAFRLWQVVEKKDGAIMVPAAFEGLNAEDSVAMVLGGSGDRFAFALSRQGERIGANVYRIPPHRLKAERIALLGTEKSKDFDHIIFAILLAMRPKLFYKVTPRERELIRVSVLYRGFKTAQKDRIACGNRIFSNLIGETFLTKEGKYPEGSIDQMFKDAKANSTVFKSIEGEENRLKKEMEKAVEALDIYQDVFKPLSETIFTPASTAPFIAVTQNILRFGSETEWLKFCGVLCKNGEFPRKRRGQRFEGNPMMRQALWNIVAIRLFYDAKSEWGQKLRAIKAHLHEQHPEPVVVTVESKNDHSDGNTRQVKRYSNLHLARMANWKMAFYIARRIYRTWHGYETRLMQQNTSSR